MIMSSVSSSVASQEHRLTLVEVLEALVADGLVSATDADALRHERRYFRGDAHPLAMVADQKIKSLQPPHKVLDLEILTEWLAKWSGLDYLHIDPLRIDFSTVTEVMSNAYATRFRILPVGVTRSEVVIATAEPFVREWEKELEPILRKNIRRVVANPLDISRFLVEFYNLARSVKNAMQREKGSGGGTSTLSNFEQLVELGRANRQLDANDQHIVHIVDWLWQYAFEQRASDIHMEPRRDIGIVRFRIDGVLHQVYQIPMPVLTAMTSRIKILGRMDVVEKRRPQDGRIKTRAADGQEVELRLSTLPTAFGEKLVMRIFDPEVLVRDFAELGFSADDTQRWNQMTAQPNGIILVTGPTGSGKTTTLYSTLKQLATPEVNVCTIEDPIEMVEASFNQVQVQHSIDMGFAQGVRALMRQDPDIILVGEMRDQETAEIGMRAAMTGHLVLSTLHTNDAITTPIRLLDMGVPRYMVALSVHMVLAQRLVRVICQNCREPWTPTPAEHEWLRYELGDTVDGRSFHHGRGCAHCGNTGYQGRIGAYEFLEMSNELVEAINHDDPGVFMQAARRQMAGETLRRDAVRLVVAGTTTVAEAMRISNQYED